MSLNLNMQDVLRFAGVAGNAVQTGLALLETLEAQHDALEPGADKDHVRAVLDAQYEKMESIRDRVLAKLEAVADQPHPASNVGNRSPG